jgi:uncharacterized membrane protein
MNVLKRYLNYRRKLAEPRFFRKDEEGRELFYPWGYPGEAFYVDETQKKQAVRFFYIIAVLLLLSIEGSNIAASRNYLDGQESFWVFNSYWLIFPFIYGLYMYFFSINLEAKKPENQSPIVLRFFLFILVAHVLYSLVSLNLYSSVRRQDMLDRMAV